MWGINLFIVVSSDPLHFCGISCSLSSFMADFYLVLPFFFINLAKDLSIFLKNEF